MVSSHHCGPTARAGHLCAARTGAACCAMMRSDACVFVQPTDLVHNVVDCLLLALDGCVDAAGGHAAQGLQGRGQGDGGTCCGDGGGAEQGGHAVHQGDSRAGRAPGTPTVASAPRCACSAPALSRGDLCPERTWHQTMHLPPPLQPALSPPAGTPIISAEPAVEVSRGMVRSARGWQR